eukprot:1914743-Pyramimonas_sp.AAC.1
MARSTIKTAIAERVRRLKPGSIRWGRRRRSLGRRGAIARRGLGYLRRLALSSRGLWSRLE